MLYFRTKRAFTLVEIMIGFLIVGVAIIPIFALFTQSTKGTDKNKKKAAGMKLAEEKLNYYMNLKFDFIKSSYINKHTVTKEGTKFGISLEWQTIPSIPFKYKTVRVIAGSTIEFNKIYNCKNSLKKLLINIEWKEGGVNKIFTLETHKADVPALKGFL
ncbi:type II secretion system protein [bacterium]|nr:type II secretion system protein [bacterium]